MTIFKKIAATGLFAMALLNISGCAPEVGSEQWCNNMKEQPKGDWSTNEATDFAKHCLLK